MANRTILNFSLCVSAGAQRPDSIPEVGEDAASAVQPISGTTLTEEEQEELHSELVKVSSLLTCLSRLLSINCVFLRFGCSTGLRRND